MIVFLVVTSVSVLGFLVTGSAAEANGSVKWYEKKIIGPYEIGLGTVPQSPSPGVVHFTVYVADIETGVKYTDIDVKFTVSAPDQDTVAIHSAAMVATLLDPSYYEADMPLGEEGLWMVFLEVSGSKGAVSTVYEVEVRKPSVLAGALGLIAFLIILTILGLSVRAWIREKRKARSSVP